MKRLFCILLLFLLGFAGFPSAGQCDLPVAPGDFLVWLRTSLDVPYVPTPEPVVDVMLSLAQPREEDVLYDLGCGDGRIVITAAKEYGIRGVGIDIDPLRIRESRENAERAGVSGKVTFRQQDLYQADFSEASILTLYLLNEINLQLRSTILSELKPGTRVLSHNFDMGAWKPEETKTIGWHTIFFWLVPANVTGTWRSSGIGLPEETTSLVFSQKFQEVTGTMNDGTTNQPLKDVQLTGGTIAFTADLKRDGVVVTARFRGRVSGDTIAGAIEQDGAQVRTWNARRDPSTRVPLDGRVIRISR